MTPAGAAARLRDLAQASTPGAAVGRAGRALEALGGRNGHASASAAGSTAPARPVPVRPPARAPVPRAPRRVSGPVRPGRTGQGAAADAPTNGLSPTAEAAALRLRGLLDAPFLDRITRGRMWIGLVAAALIGIVFTQVSLLRLNASIGRSVQKAQALERQNAQLRDSVSRLGSNDRIQDAAASRGMILPKAGTFRYLIAGTRPDVDRALRTLKPPVLAAPTLGPLPAVSPSSSATAGASGTTSSGATTGAPGTASSAATTPAGTTTAAKTAPATTTTGTPAQSATSGSAPATVVPSVAVAQPAPGQQATQSTSPPPTPGQTTTAPATR